MKMKHVVGQWLAGKVVYGLSQGAYQVVQWSGIGTYTQGIAYMGETTVGV